VSLQVACDSVGAKLSDVETHLREIFVKKGLQLSNRDRFASTIN
jgi:hypothetical protein